MGQQKLPQIIISNIKYVLGVGFICSKIPLHDYIQARKPHRASHDGLCLLGRSPALRWSDSLKTGKDVTIGEPSPEKFKNRKGNKTKRRLSTNTN